MKQFQTASCGIPICDDIAYTYDTRRQQVFNAELAGHKKYLEKEKNQYCIGYLFAKFFRPKKSMENHNFDGVEDPLVTLKLKRMT